jgi:hypothetical protein
MAIKLKVPSRHVVVNMNFDSERVSLSQELSLWLLEKDTKSIVTYRMIVDPTTFQPAPFTLIEFEDETVALEYKLRWL